MCDITDQKICKKMPELPEVQTTIDGLIKEKIIDSNILDTAVDHKNMIFPFSIEEFRKTIIGKSIKKIFRKGKYIFFELEDNLHLIIHLRMSGKFVKGDYFPLEKHEHAAFKFSNGNILKFHDPRKFGKITLTREVGKTLARIGIDALDSALSYSWLKKRITTKKKPLKALLLDQSFISGIGNIYADEILFDSKLHPMMQAYNLKGEKIKDLYRSIKKILGEAVIHRGTSLGDGLSNFKSFHDLGTHQNYLAVYGRANEPCIRCGKKIFKQVVCQRGTYTCPNCQVLPIDHEL